MTRTDAKIDADLPGAKPLGSPAALPPGGPAAPARAESDWGLEPHRPGMTREMRLGMLLVLVLLCGFGALLGVKFRDRLPSWDAVLARITGKPAAVAEDEGEHPTVETLDDLPAAPDDEELAAAPAQPTNDNPFAAGEEEEWTGAEPPAAAPTADAPLATVADLTNAPAEDLFADEPEMEAAPAPTTAAADEELEPFAAEEAAPEASLADAPFDEPELEVTATAAPLVDEPAFEPEPELTAAPAAGAALAADVEGEEEMQFPDTPASLADIEEGEELVEMPDAGMGDDPFVQPASGTAPRSAPAATTPRTAPRTTPRTAPRTTPRGSNTAAEAPLGDFEPLDEGTAHGGSSTRVAQPAPTPAPATTAPRVTAAKPPIPPTSPRSAKQDPLGDFEVAEELAMEEGLPPDPVEPAFEDLVTPAPKSAAVTPAPAATPAAAPAPAAPRNPAEVNLEEFEPEPAAEFSPAAPVSEPTGGAGPRSTPLPTRPRDSATFQNFDPRADNQVYVVQPHDNFWTISRKTYGTGRYFMALAKHNEKSVPDPKKMKPGQKISVPSKTTLESRYPKLISGLAPAGSTTAAAASSPAAGGGFFVGPGGEPQYRVGSDDTLSGISHNHLGRASRWTEIFDMNRTALGTPDALKVGTVLKLPRDASQLGFAEKGTIRR